jgi:signal peptidase II
VDPRRALAAAAVVSFAADQITKAFALAALNDGESVPVVDGVLHWTLQRNPGAAFGLFQRVPVLFTILAIAIVVVILAAAPRVRHMLNGVALGLVLGGALGNLADRLIRPPGPFRGRVIDFIDFRVWPTFNLADVAVVVGAGLLAIASVRSDRRAASDTAGEGRSPS